MIKKIGGLKVAQFGPHCNNIVENNLGEKHCKK